MTLSHSLRRFTSAAAVAGAALLAGCATFNSVDASVASFGEWPAGTAPGTYAFDRLPSQLRNPQRQQSLENAAAQALANAGFRPAADGTKPAVMVQIGARTERFEQAPWDDPFWWGGPRRFGYGGWVGPGPYGPWGPYGFHHGLWAPFPPQPDIYLHEVALLIRDRHRQGALRDARQHRRLQLGRRPPAGRDVRRLDEGLPAHQRPGAHRARRAADGALGGAAGDARERFQRLKDHPSPRLR